MGKASIPKPSMEEEIGEAVRTMPRLPRHQPEEFETPRPPIEYAPPATREDFVEAAAAASLELPAERMMVVEQGLVALQQSHADRDRMRRENATLKVRIAELEARIRVREDEDHAIEKRREDAERIIEARVRDCLMQRDNAVAEASELRGVLSSLGAILVGYYKPERHNGEAPQSEGNEHVPVPSQAAS